MAQYGGTRSAGSSANNRNQKARDGARIHPAAIVAILAVVLGVIAFIGWRMFGPDAGAQSTESLKAAAAKAGPWNSD